jgi:hypothetical protein
MARVKRTTSPAAKVVADQIERPHGGASVKKVGPATDLEAQALSGRNGARAGSVTQVGPTDIRRPAGPTGSVKVVGGGNFEDEFARRGGFLDIPYARQSGAVRQVGPASREFSRVLEGTGGAGSFRSGRLPRTSGLITGTPLLVSGAGRRYPFGVYVGSGLTGTKTAADVAKGAAGGSLLISGRRRGTPPPQAESSDQVTPYGPTIVPGHLGDTVLRAPEISGEASSAVTDTEATLDATIDPRGRDTDYVVEYGTDDTYGTEVDSGTIEAGDGATSVGGDLTGLDPETDYHWRVTASNDIGDVEGDDQTFTTDAAP